MRIAVLSDIHGNLLALEAVLEDLARRDVDLVVNLGDSVSGPLQPAETAALLMAQPWIHLAGNHERQLLDFTPEKRGPADHYAHARLDAKVFGWMATLRPTQALSSEVFLCHGSPRSDAEYFLESVDGARVRPATADEIDERLGGIATSVVVCGHSHVPRIARSRAGSLLVNPGSVGLQAYEDDHPHCHVVENNSPDARYAIVEQNSRGWCAQLHSVPYDHAAAAAAARAHGREDWALALMCGRMA